MWTSNLQYYKVILHHHEHTFVNSYKQYHSSHADSHGPNYDKCHFEAHLVMVMVDVPIEMHLAHNNIFNIFIVIQWTCQD
jgi:hypothetical protein